MSKTTKHKPLTRWEDKDKRRALAVYKSLGNLAKTAEVTGIPDRTLEFWTTQDWWKEGLKAIKAEDTAELEEAATTIAKMGGDIVKERLRNGDFVLTKDGELIRKPVSARDASVITAIAIDKRRVLQEEPIREQQLDSSERLLKLVEQFARFASAKELKGVVKEAEYRELKDEDAIQPALQEGLQTRSEDGIQVETGIPSSSQSRSESSH